MSLYHFAMISLATIGVCVFSAFASVGALFYFAENEKVHSISWCGVHKLSAKIK